MSLILDGTTGVPVTTVTGTLPVANGGTGVATAIDYGFKNRIINGGMVVSQRGATNVVAGGGSTYIAADRFNVFNYFGSGQVNTAVSTSIVPTGYAYSLGLTVNTAVPLSGTTGYAINVAQTIEGFNISDCYTQTVTLSFWVRSSITGTYSVSFSNATNVGLSATSRIYVTNYTINAANTWEQKTINVNLSTGTASGTWLSDNGAGLNLAWGLGAESNRKGNTYLDTWGTIGTTYNVQSSAQTQWAATSGATFYITGVQLEKGSTATSFDYRPYGTELALCQRYYEILTIPASTAALAAGQNTASYFTATWQLKQTKRAVPTYTVGVGGYSGATPSSYPQIDIVYLSASTTFYINGTSGNIGASASAEL